MEIGFEVCEQNKRVGAKTLINIFGLEGQFHGVGEGEVKARTGGEVVGVEAAIEWEGMAVSPVIADAGSAACWTDCCATGSNAVVEWASSLTIVPSALTLIAVALVTFPTMTEKASSGSSTVSPKTLTVNDAVLCPAGIV